MENYRLLEAGMPNLVSALKGNPVSVKRLITFDEDVNESALEEAISRTVKTFPLLGKKLRIETEFIFTLIIICRSSFPKA